ncbi:Pyridoxamine 5'-phosphate oxidase [Novipirellula galeiformis]|uniref:Pyridoxamine 5'-phosphate oxidase n=1 Tax=Novipirellula galeiformis TaxID=2528004 RepID=A0A5C6CCC9_9BACT|nr:pyridoxamine 5'-phosphate oxidase family protein [Novipirellula galeiformis]TWU21685.1 Pyridoxamine 5'-phosphate oxidase [Novipirellula galeiformis]
MDKYEKLVDLMGDFDSAMLVTRCSDGSLEARPMAVAELEPDGGLWFVTDRNSGKVADLRLDDEVAVTMQGSNKFASLAGTARAIDDRAKLDQLWNDAWKVWFPEGKTSASIVLLHVEPQRGEYWDQSGVTGLKYLIKAGKAYLQGKRVSNDASVNATVSM